jgi:hypothetical protein
MKKVILNLSAIAIVATTIVVLIIASCKKSESVVTPNTIPNEFLTTVVFQCINTAAPYDTTCGVWRIFPNQSHPDTSEAFLKYHKSATYACHIFVLDETKTPVSAYASDTSFNINTINSNTVNVTTELIARANYHLYCFYMTGGTLSSNLTVVRTDHDTNNPPLPCGFTDNITTNNPTSGSMEIQQQHQPNVKNGTCGPGSLDFDVFFKTTIY